MTIAHLSDVHLSPVRGLGPLHANLKRGLGLANWLLKRRKVHLRSVVDALVADLRSQKPDHIVVSGDLVNLGLPGEHEHALAWLDALGPASQVTVVPGNHDIYCRLWRDRGVERWRAYMTSNAQGAKYARPAERGFPFVRILGKVALVGVVSAVPTPPFYATGQVGRAQLEALDHTLGLLGRDDLTRIVVIHHPPLPGQADSRRGLTDAPQLEQVLRLRGAELVLHGHNHVDMRESRPWAGGTIEVIGVASASVGRAYKEEPLGRYNLIRLEGAWPKAPFEVVSRGLDWAGGKVVELARQTVGAAGATAKSP